MLTPSPGFLTAIYFGHYSLASAQELTASHMNMAHGKYEMDSIPLLWNLKPMTNTTRHFSCPWLENNTGSTEGSSGHEPGLRNTVEKLIKCTVDFWYSIHNLPWLVYSIFPEILQFFPLLSATSMSSLWKELCKWVRGVKVIHVPFDYRFECYEDNNGLDTM